MQIGENYAVDHECLLVRASQLMSDRIMYLRILLLWTLTVTVCDPVLGARLTLLPEWLDSPDLRLFMLSDGRTFAGIDGTDVFRWSAAEGRTSIGTMPTSYGSANVAIHVTHVTDDGSKFIGRVGDDFFDPAFGFVWTIDDGFVRMPGSFDSTVLSPTPTAISGDGEVIVGTAWEYLNGLDGESRQIAFRWTPQTGTTSLGFTGSPIAVSADGRTVAGTWSNPGQLGEAFRWTEQGGVAGLGFLSSESRSSVASDMSADGQVIVGVNFGGPPILNSKAVMWTSQAGIEQLSTRGDEHELFEMSADGHVVIGLMRTNLEAPTRTVADDFVWRRDEGLRTISELIDEYDLDDVEPFTDAGKYQQLYSVSADGRILFGGSLEIDFTDNPGVPVFRHDYWLLDISSVPEPDSSMLYLIGCLAMMVRGNRIRSQRLF